MFDRPDYRRLTLRFNSCNARSHFIKGCDSIFRGGEHESELKGKQMCFNLAANTRLSFITRTPELE